MDPGHFEAMWTPAVFLGVLPTHIVLLRTSVIGVCCCHGEICSVLFFVNWHEWGGKSFPPEYHPVVRTSALDNSVVSCVNVVTDFCMDCVAGLAIIILELDYAFSLD